MTFGVLSGPAASWVVFCLALQIGDASRIAPSERLSLVFVAVLAALFLEERLSTTGAIGIRLIAVGAVVSAL